MATVKVSHAHSLSPDEAKQRIAEVFDGYRGRFGITHRWEGDRLILSGSGFDGEARVNASVIDVEIRLGFAASMFKGQVESGIRSELEKRLKA